MYIPFAKLINFHNCKLKKIQKARSTFRPQTALDQTVAGGLIVAVDWTFGTSFMRCLANGVGVQKMSFCLKHTLMPLV